jgi:hypothetical protein
MSTLGSSAQTPTPTPTPGYSDTEDAKPIAAVKGETPRTLDELKAIAKKNKTDDDVLFVWDKFKDESIVMAKPENIVGSWEGAFAIMGSSGPYGRTGTPRLIMVHLEWRFGGKTMQVTPDRFALVFSGMSPDWQFLKTGDTLYLLYDGEKRMKLEALATERDVVKYNRVDEKIAYVITREQVAELAAAKKVELRIGEARPREIKPKLLKRWQALLEATQLERAK